MLFIFTMITLKAINIINLTDNIIITMVVSIFVETLGVVTIMVRKSFDATPEIEVIKAIQKIAESYKKS